MPARAIDLHPAYFGMMTAVPAADLPPTHCQSLSGFTPSRNGQLNLAPLIKTLEQKLGITIYGTAVYIDAIEGDQLLFFDGARLYFTSLVNSWKDDTRSDGPHSYYSLPSTTNLTAVVGVAPFEVESIQYHGELILSVQTLLYRFYVSSGVGKFFILGLDDPTIAIASQTTGGSLMPSQTYSYVATWVDEKGRESSPSASVSVTLTATNNSVIINETGSTGNPIAQGAVSWNLYRMNPGSKTFNFVANIAIATGSFTDTLADSVVQAGASAPTPGENDPPSLLGPGFPHTGDILEIWKDRLLIGTVTDGTVMMSNAGSPTQFSSLDLPTNVADGLRFTLSGVDTCTGLVNLGSLLAVFGRQTTELLYGDDITDFTLRPTLERGCLNPRSIQRCENEVLFLSDDGVYSIGYESGYTVQKKSAVLDDIFTGFQPTVEIGEPRSIGLPQSIQVVNSNSLNVRSLYMNRRYYLSMTNRTLCYDVENQSWSDTGWGFMKTVTHYQSSNAPETAFITLADLNTNVSTLNYFTVSDTPTDRDAPPTVSANVVYRPVDAQPGKQVRKKRVVMLSQYGSTAAPKGAVIGKAVWYVDGYPVQTVPICAHVVWARQGALFEIAAPAVSGELIWCSITYTPNDLVLGNAVFEFVYVD